jgi:hypothetical protein
MIEVFKTNVTSCDDADMIVKAIHTTFECYKANFDLQDCDKILRVCSAKKPIHSVAIVDILNNFGFEAQVLPDAIPSPKISLHTVQLS